MGVHETTEFLELFLRNLLLGEKNELHNCAMHISGSFAFETKADIQSPKADIQPTKADIREKIVNTSHTASDKTIAHALLLYDKFGRDQIFGRSIVEEVTGLRSTRASELIGLLLESEIIEPIKGYGKGKYHFK